MIDKKQKLMISCALSTGLLVSTANVQSAPTWPCPAEPLKMQKKKLKQAQNFSFNFVTNDSKKKPITNQILLVTAPR